MTYARQLYTRRSVFMLDCQLQFLSQPVKSINSIDVIRFNCVMTLYFAIIVLQNFCFTKQKTCRKNGFCRSVERMWYHSYKAHVGPQFWLTLSGRSSNCWWGRMTRYRSVSLGEAAGTLCKCKITQYKITRYQLKLWRYVYVPFSRDSR